tara:strand:+ start:214 stop:483 length:270 start_codon:yes stop_codon:yes gene_type:complete
LRVVAKVVAVVISVLKVPETANLDGQGRVVFRLLTEKRELLFVGTNSDLCLKQLEVRQTIEHCCHKYLFGQWFGRRPNRVAQVVDSLSR